MTITRTKNRDCTTLGSRMVLHSRNTAGGDWTSNLYVNHGETITAIRGTHKTLAGAKRWAARQLAA